MFEEVRYWTKVADNNDDTANNNNNNHNHRKCNHKSLGQFGENSRDTMEFHRSLAKQGRGVESGGACALFSVALARAHVSLRAIFTFVPTMF